MEIRIETTSYNERRYGKPWIAIVDFTKSTKGEFAWGDWTGDHYNGGAGVLTIFANPGDIIAQGQKDNRKPKNSAPEFSVVGVGGELEHLGDKGAAYKHYLEHKNSTPEYGALIAEKTCLMARVNEIDVILGALKSDLVPTVATAKKQLYQAGLDNN